jgi:hypothetical protein
MARIVPPLGRCVIVSSTYEHRSLTMKSPCIAYSSHIRPGPFCSENRSGHGWKKQYSIAPMRRSIALILIGFSVTGCKSQAPVYDPFLGRSTIPPPATGAIAGQTSDPNNPQPPSMLPPGSTAGPALMPGQPATSSALPGPATTSTPTTPQPLLPPPNAQNSAPNQGLWTPKTPTPTSPLAPRPTSTTPSPGTTSPYAPPGGFGYPGNSNQPPPPATPPTSALPGPQSSVTVSQSTSYSRPPSVSYTNASAVRSVMIGDGRMPRPVDDTAGQKPAVRIVPTGNTRPGKPIDINDLPSK